MLTPAMSVARARSAKIELSNGVGDRSSVFGDTVEQTYLQIVDCEINELKHPINPRVFMHLSEEEVNNFRVQQGGIVFNAYDFAGEYLAIEWENGVLSFYAIDCRE